MSELILKMPKTESRSNTGINDSGIETYKNKPMLSLTKEELQNSTDNVLPGKMCEVIFSDFMISTEKLPDINNVKDIYTNEYKYWDSFVKNDRKTPDFLKKALAILNKDKIRCLRISDYNTTGLTGIKGNESTPWQNLVNNTGVSDKPGHSGGSFGIGKNAAFACSNLRMVFYNTLNIDEGTNQAFQGLVKLPSYKLENKNFDGSGVFYDKDGDLWDPIFSNLSLEDGYVRKTSGMDKYIIGFDDNLDSDTLKDEVIISSINNFLYAFWSGKLKVTYGDIVIDKNSLAELFTRYSNHSSLDILTKDYYMTLSNPQEEFDISVFEDNDVKVYLTLNPDFHRRAAVVRQSGMKVFDKDRLSGNIGFSAVIVLVGDKVNGYFKKLENAEHNQWSEFRSEDRTTVINNQKKIFDAVRNKIRELHQDDYETSMDSDGMSDYLPYTYVTGKKEKKDALTNEVEEIKKAKTIKNKPKKENTEDNKYSLDENGNLIINIDDEHRGVTPPGPGPTPPNPFPPVEPVVDPNGDPHKVSLDEDGTFILSKHISSNNFNTKLKHNSLLNEYTLRMIPKAKINHGFIELSISGEQDATPINVVEAKIDGIDVKIKGNKIAFDGFKENEPHDFKFRLANNEEWSLEVSVNENKK